MWQLIETKLPELSEKVTEFLVGDKIFLNKKCAAYKIARWYKTFPNLNYFDDNRSKSFFVRLMMREYTTEQILNYPIFARNKMRLYLSNFVPEFNPDNKPITKVSVVRWIVDNLDEPDLALVGF